LERHGAIGTKFGTSCGRVNEMMTAFKMRLSIYLGLPSLNQWKSYLHLIIALQNEWLSEYFRCYIHCAAPFLP